MAHPSLFITEHKTEGSRSVDDVREAIKTGHAATLWRSIRDRCDADCSDDPIVPESRFPGRDLTQAEWANRDWTVCNVARKRVLRAALVALLTGKTSYREEALRQAETLFDEKKWPIWRDKATAHMRYPADLRTGMLSRELAIAYDWLYPMLSHAERSSYLAGLDRCGIQPYLASVEQDAWWIHSRHNWTTCVVGGLGIAGMALGEDHPEANGLVEFAVPIMRDYVEHAYGPEGEFNESVGYSSATRLPMVFFAALRSSSQGADDELTGSIFPQALRWYQYFIVPPGRGVAFGDAHLDAPPDATMFALAAAAFEDGVFQWFYLNHQLDSIRRDLEFELIWYDPAIEPVDPEATLPRGRMYAAHGACVSSRSSWDHRSAANVVCGKAGIETNHQHHDAGNVVIDGYGERLIVDTGSPSEYPEDLFGPDRYRYYNTSSLGHNLVSVNHAETVDGVAGHFVGECATDHGYGWAVDLTALYPSALSVTRSVAHLYAGVVAVCDRVTLREPSAIGIRWHTVSDPAFDEHGGFTLSAGAARLSGRVVDIDGRGLERRLDHHRYEAPFDTGRSGKPLEQRHEPFLEYLVSGADAFLLSLFAVGCEGTPPGSWSSDGTRASVCVGGMEVTVLVSITESVSTLRIRSEEGAAISIEAPVC